MKEFNFKRRVLVIAALGAFSGASITGFCARCN
jgi:hypothetical protein